MGRVTSRALLIVLLMLAGSIGAQAQFDVLPEIRAGVMSHDVSSSTLWDPARIRDANVELLFSVQALDGAMLGEFRPHVGMTVNTAGQESFGYAGLSYTLQLPVLPVFVEASLGAAVHGGPLVAATTPQRFGCAALARVSGSVGIDLLPGASIMATVEHYSDGGLCGMASNGVTNVGVRLGIRF